MIALPVQLSNAQIALLAAVEHKQPERYRPSEYAITEAANVFLQWLNDKDAE